MKYLKCLLLLLPLLPLSQASASNMEGEKPVIKVTSNDGKFEIDTVVYLQARAEYGDLVQGPSAEVVSDDFDLYLRRASIGFYGRAYESKLRFGVTISGDETPEYEIYPGYSEDHSVAYDTYVSYEWKKRLSVRFGKEKLPYSRSYLVSSSRQIFSERPYYAMSWSEILKSFTSSHISVHDKRFPIQYSLSVAKTWRAGEDIYDGVVLTESNPQYSGRISWSPSGWGQDKLSDVNMGLGRHLSFGMYTAYVDGLEYEEMSMDQTEQRSIYGIDASFHQNSFQFTLEANGWEIDASDPNRDRQALGWVAQSAYFFDDVQLEPALRMERFITDRDQAHTDVKKFTIGINKYINGNDLKLNADVEYAEFDENVTFLKPVDKDQFFAVRLTCQFIL